MFTQRVNGLVTLKQNDSLHLWGVESEIGEQDEKRANHRIALYQIMRTAAEAVEWNQVYEALKRTRAPLVSTSLRRGAQWGLGAAMGMAACGWLCRMHRKNIVVGSAISGAAFLGIGISLHTLDIRKHYARFDAWYHANPLIPESQWVNDRNVCRLKKQYPQALKPGMVIRSLQDVSNALEKAVQDGVPCYGGGPQRSMKRLAPGLSLCDLGVISFIGKNSR
jgi:hypothetical protein